MFEEPAAKRVRRDELYGSDRSDDAASGDEAIDLELRAQLNDQIAKSLGLDQIETFGSTRQRNDQISVKKPTKASRASPSESDDDEDGAVDNQSDEEFEFQLFSNSEPTAKVVLEDDSLGDGALVNKRPASHYLAPRVSESQRKTFGFAAVTAEQILERAKVPSWGFALPWKVVHATSPSHTGLQVQADGETMEDKKQGKAGRPGKKKRVALRTKARAAEAKAKAASEKMAEKEEYIKDKKKRMNRAKKLRRRAKEREKKAGGAGAEDSESDDSA